MEGIENSSEPDMVENSISQSLVQEESTISNDSNIAVKKKKPKKKKSSSDDGAGVKTKKKKKKKKRNTNLDETTKASSTSTTGKKKKKKKKTTTVEVGNDNDETKSDLEEKIPISIKPIPAGGVLALKTKNFIGRPPLKGSNKIEDNIRKKAKLNILKSSSMSSADSPKMKNANSDSITKSSIIPSESPKLDRKTSFEVSQHRGRIILEIIQTELSYSILLAEFHTVFYSSLESCDNPIKRLFMGSADLAGLCSNIEQIYHLSQQLLNELNDAVDQGRVEYENQRHERRDYARSLSNIDDSFGQQFSSTFNKQQRDEENKLNGNHKTTPQEASFGSIGPVFERFATLLRIYEQYAENHSFASYDIKKFTAKEQFNDFWNNTWRDHLLKKLNFNNEESSKPITVNNDETQSNISNTSSNITAKSAPISRNLNNSTSSSVNEADSLASNESSTLSNNNSKRQSIFKKKNVKHKRHLSGTGSQVLERPKSVQFNSTSTSSISSQVVKLTPQQQMSMKPATPLDGYLILPIQRVPRYVLLLRELHKHTLKLYNYYESMLEDLLEAQEIVSIKEEHQPIVGEDEEEYIDDIDRLTRLRNSSTIDPEPFKELDIDDEIERVSGMILFLRSELQSIHVAKTQVEGAATQMNEAIRNSERNEELKKLQRLFINGGVDLVGLCADGTGQQRRIVKEGELMRVTKRGIHKEFYFHLFSDAIIYSERNPNGYFRFHRALPIDAQCSIQLYKPQKSWFEKYSGYCNIPLERLKSESPMELEHNSRAFKLITSTKSLLVYAQTDKIKNQWLIDIKQNIYAIQERAKILGEIEKPIFFDGDEDNCQICNTSFKKVKRKKCKRCGVPICIHCCDRRRILNRGKPEKVCDCCRLEMDLTANDDMKNQFRLFLKVESIKNVEQLAKKRTEDVKDSTGRCYFQLNQYPFEKEITLQKIPMHRGPSSIGHEASFMIPIGPLPPDGYPLKSSRWVLHTNLLTTGEVGSIVFDMADIMCSEAMRENGKVVNTYRLDNLGKKVEKPVELLISMELILPPAFWLDENDLDAYNLIEKEQQEEEERKAREEEEEEAANANNNNNNNNTNVLPRKGSYNVLKMVNDNTNNNNDKALRKLSKDTVDSDFSPLGRGADYSIDASTIPINTFKSISERLNRFTGIDDFVISSSLKSAMEKSVKPSDQRESRKLNIKLLSKYEKLALISKKEQFWNNGGNKEIWAYQTVQYLYKDCRNKLYSVTDITDPRRRALNERIRKFNHHPLMQPFADMEKRFEEEKLHRSISKASSTLLSISTTTSRNSIDSLNTNRSPLSLHDQLISPKALDYYNNGLSDKSIIENDDDDKNETNLLVTSTSASTPPTTTDLIHDPIKLTPRSQVLNDLLKTERAYNESLAVLDDVFVTPLMHIAHGASVKNMRMSQQFGVNSRGGDLDREGKLKKQTQAVDPNKKSINFIGITSEDSTNSRLSKILRRNTSESHAIAKIIRNPDVTVLLQSVRQIHTVNKQLLNDLELRLQNVDDSKQIGDIFARFAVVLKVYNSYATTYRTVDGILNSSSLASLNRSTSSGSSSNKTNDKTKKKKDDDNKKKKKKKKLDKNESSLKRKGGNIVNMTNGQSFSQQALDGLSKLIYEFERDERCNNLPFKHYLKLPVERLGRYKRILTALLMHTPSNHPDIEPVRLSIDILKSSQSHISGSVFRKENLERLQRIKTSLVETPLSKSIPFELVDSNRWLIREGYLVKRCKREDKLYKFYLFSDVLIYGRKRGTTTNGEDRFKFHRAIPLVDLTVEKKDDLLERKGNLSSTIDGNTNTPSTDAIGDHKYCLVFNSKQKSFYAMIPMLDYPTWSIREARNFNSNSIAEKKKTPLKLNSLDDDIVVNNNNVDDDDDDDGGNKTIKALKSLRDLGQKNLGSSRITRQNSDTAIKIDSGVYGLLSPQEKDDLRSRWLRDLIEAIAEADSSTYFDDENAKIDHAKMINSSSNNNNNNNNESIQLKKKFAAAIWDPDENSTKCPRCDRKFTTFFRRHHCRNCGGLICGKCSTNRLILENISTKPVRVCDTCYLKIEEGDEDEIQPTQL